MESNQPLGCQVSGRFAVLAVASVKAARLHIMKVCRGSRSIAPLILNLGTEWRSVVYFTVRPLYPQEEVGSCLRTVKIPKTAFCAVDVCSSDCTSLCPLLLLVAVKSELY